MLLGTEDGIFLYEITTKVVDGIETTFFDGKLVTSEPGRTTGVFQFEGTGIDVGK
jgi:hypothetical protein